MWMGSKPVAMRFFRESSLEQLPVSIAGIKLGDRLLMLGAGDPKLLAQLAVKTGLTGRACVIDDDAARIDRAGEVATREGALVETITAPFAQLPVDDASFDVAIVRDTLGTQDSTARQGVVRELVRALRPGGRCLVIDGGRRTLGGLLSKGSVQADYDAVASLEGAAFRAVRIVAERDGLKFVEGVKENLR